MRKFKILCIVAIFAASFMPTQISAKVETNEKVTIEYLENGNYVETIITEENTTNTMMGRATSSKTGSKTEFYRNGDGEVMWTIAVRASFTYNGSTATCTQSSVITTCPSNMWKVSNTSASRKGNTGTAYATGKRYTNGFVVESVNRSVTLTCSGNGTLY